MISILIVDDNNDKISEIISVVREKFDDLHIEVNGDSFSAQRSLVKNKYDLLILDLNLPFRKDDIPNPDGGKILLQEINRNDRIICPNYIIGLSQFVDSNAELSSIWNVLKYDPADSGWTIILQQLITHAVRARRNSSITNSKIETVYVEGKSDKRIILDGLKVFYPEYLDKIVIKESDGASFVSRQIIILAKSLAKNAQGDYIKALGLLDGDDKGNEAKSEIYRVVPENSAEMRTFKTIQLNKKYAKHLIPIFTKGVNIPITLEEIFPFEVWKYAEEQNWLDNRSNVDDFLNDPKSWDKFNISLK
jgi:CheY-like chemotaxis protein